MATLTGTSGSDTITGTDDNDSINGLEGNDYLNGGNGNDILFGGPGNDVLIGGAGDDEIDGGVPTTFPSTLDTVDYSSAAGAILVAPDGNVTGAAGHDHVSNVRRFIGSNFDDVMELPVHGSTIENPYFRLEGGGGNDTLTGSGKLLGGTGNDILNANGPSTLNGGAGDDILHGNGVSVLIGGAGNDWMGDGRVDYSSATSALTVDLAVSGPQNTGSSTGIDTLVNIVNVVGSSQADNHLSGNALANSLGGGNGDDVIDGRAGDDSLTGGDGNDVLGGGAGADELNDGAGNDVLRGGAGADRLFDTSGNDVLAGDAGNDILVFGVGDDLLIGGDGIDSIEFPSLTIGAPVDATINLTITVAQDTGYGMDRLRDIENLGGGMGNDRLVGTTGANIINGWFGNDTLGGLGGADTLNGGSGDDKIAGGAGNDLLIGENGADELLGGAGADIFAYMSFGDSYLSVVDTIDDFQQGSDHIDLSAIDADENTLGNQAFTFIGSAAFSGALGELRQFDDGAGHTVIEGNVHTYGPTVADFQILLKGAYTLQSSDFIL